MRVLVRVVAPVLMQQLVPVPVPVPVLVVQGQALVLVPFVQSLIRDARAAMVCYQ